MVEQIEFADVVIINKAKSVTPDQLAIVRKVVAGLNADARIVEADFAKVALDDILDTGLFDDEQAEQHPLWFKELHGFASHRPESEEYGVESFVYRARRPFDPVKFHKFSEGGWQNVIRAKGHFWIATRPDWVGELAQAGAQTTTSGMGRWWAAVPKERWPDKDHYDQWVGKHWDTLWGDRRQEIVFIGIGMDQAALTAQLDACLVPETLFVPDMWRKLRDPFPAWGQQAQAA